MRTRQRLLAAFALLTIVTACEDPSSSLASRTTPPPVETTAPPPATTTTPTARATTAKPAPKPSPTPTKARVVATPRRTPSPTPVRTTTKPKAAASTCGAPANPWGYNFCGRGGVIYDPPASFCSVFDCIASFWESTNGYVMQCDDLMFSHSGGRSGSCSHHGGNYRALDGG